jgi:hypothetical protein
MSNVFLNKNTGNMTKKLKDTIIRELKLPNDTEFEHKLPVKSAYGVIFPIKGTDKVLKVIRGKHAVDNDFNTEVSIGKKQGIGKVGTRIYEHAYFGYKTVHLVNGHVKFRDYIGAYVMDNLLSMREKKLGWTVINLNIYTREHNSCSREIIKMYTNLLFNFYKISGGWHGDLHSGNIQVILDDKGKPKRMMVIDYGSHTPFINKTRANSAKCLDDVLKVVKSNFKSMPYSVQFTSPGWSGPHRVRSNVTRRQAVASNKSALNTHSFYLTAKTYGININNANNSTENVNERNRLNKKYRNEHRNNPLYDPVRYVNTRPFPV